jgi:pimeloyl-ACP methyl ester carboxylesterase
MKEFSSDGVRIAYQDYPPHEPARGLPVVLIHGFASNHGVNWVFPQWTRTLNKAGRRVLALDNRGHGRSEKLYDPALYTPALMARDAVNLLDHLGIARADFIGYSMGARIAARLAHDFPSRVRGLVLGGLGVHLVDGAGLPIGIADAMEAPSLDGLTDPMQRMFRAFAEATKSDLRALAACMRGARAAMSAADVGRIPSPTLVCVGDEDDVAGDPFALAAMMPHARALNIPGRDHNRAVGDKEFKDGVLAFFESLDEAGA